MIHIFKQKETLTPVNYHVFVCTKRLPIEIIYSKLNKVLLNLPHLFKKTIHFLFFFKEKCDIRTNYHEE